MWFIYGLCFVEAFRFVVMIVILTLKQKDGMIIQGSIRKLTAFLMKKMVLQNDNDYRTNGFGNLKYAMGNFKNDIFGDYIRYTHASCHSYVVVNIDGKILVVNGENDAETKEIYQRISEKVSKERK